MTMKMRNSQVQIGVIVQQMKQRWSYYNQSPSGRLLGVEPDYPSVFKGIATLDPSLKWGSNAACKLFAVGGVRGG